MLSITGHDEREAQRMPRHPVRRGPRADELALMRSLTDGPRRVSAGPIGRCVKRGWCRAMILDAAPAVRNGVSVLYALTDVGSALLDAS